MLNKQHHIQICVLAIAFGIFGSVYVLKEPLFINQIISLLSVLIAATAYIYSLHIAPGLNHISTGFLIFTAIIVRIGAIPIPIFVDDLLYRTIWDGWLQTNGVNPYLYVPGADQLELLKNNSLYPLIFRDGHFASSSPFFEVIYRFIGFLFDHLGLAYTILIHKGVSILADVAIIYSLFKLSEITDIKYHHIVALAWNPFLILFFTSQGLLIQLSALPLIWFFYYFSHKQFSISAMIWGLVMLTSPIGWFGLPLIIFRMQFATKKWIFLSLAILTYVAWWLPFAGVEQVENYLLGLTGFWVNGITHLSLGNALTSTDFFPGYNLELILLAVTLSLLLTGLVILSLSRSPISLHTLSKYIFSLALALFFISPSIILSVIPPLFILAAFTNNKMRITAVVSTLLLCNFLYWQYNPLYPAIIFTFFILLTGIVYFWKDKTVAGTWLHTY